MPYSKKLAGAFCLFAGLCSSSPVLGQYASVGSSSNTQPMACSTAGSPSSGNITVRMTDGLDSASQKPGDYSEAVVTRSTIAAVPSGSQAIVQLVTDATAGGFGMQLQQIRVGSKVMCTASSSAALAGGWAARMNNTLRVPGAPRDAVGGARVFVPETTDIAFTLTTPPVPSPTPSPEQAPTAADPAVLGSEAFDYKKQPLLAIPSVAALLQRFRAIGGVARLRTGQFQGTMDPAMARENIITDNHLPDLPACCFRGTRMAHFNAGDNVIVIDVRAFTSGDHDILHFVMESSFPIFGNVAFVLPRGKLATMSEPELETLITSWMILPAAPPVRARAAEAIGVTQDGPTPGWVVNPALFDPVTRITSPAQVLLHGSTNLTGESATASLVLECVKGSNAVGLSVRFAESALEQFDLGSFEGEDGVGQDRKLFRFAVGSLPAPWGHVDGGRSIIGTYQLDTLSDPLQRQMLQQLVPAAPGTAVVITVLPPSGKGQSLTVRFVLPANQQALRSYMAPCLHTWSAR